MLRAETAHGMAKTHWKTIRLADGIFARLFISEFYDMVMITTPDTTKPGKGRKFKRVCFANRTAALGYIREVVGVEAQEVAAESECPELEEEVCGTCIAADSYPEDYYGTMGILYNVDVCFGDGDYGYFENVPSTDFAKHCPGDVVFVVISLADDTPADLLSDAQEVPCGEPAFPPRLEVKMTSGEITEYPVLIVPYLAERGRSELREDPVG